MITSPPISPQIILINNPDKGVFFYMAKKKGQVGHRLLKMAVAGSINVEN